MKRGLFLVLAIAFLLAFGGTAYAVPISAGDDIVVRYFNNDSSNSILNGGPFEATVNGVTFLTFCVERTESFTPGASYKVDALNDTTVESNKTLTNFAAWMYSEAVSVYNSGEYTINDLQLFQLALWYEFGELTAYGLNSYGGKDFYDNMYAAYGSSDWNESNLGIGNVRVINMVDGNGEHRQDMLVSVPEPGTALLLGGLFLGLGIIGKRRFLKG